MFHFLKFLLFPFEKIAVPYMNTKTEIKFILTDTFWRFSSQNQLGFSTRTSPKEKLCIHSEALLGHLHKTKHRRDEGQQGEEMYKQKFYLVTDAHKHCIT